MREPQWMRPSRCLGTSRGGIQVLDMGIGTCPSSDAGGLGKIGTSAMTLQGLVVK